MNYTLLGSLTSPFVRRLRLYMANIPHEFEIVNWAESEEDARLTQVSPLKRIPVLLVDGKPLWESRIIFQYLQREHEKSALSLEEENIVSAIDTLQDQLIQPFLMQRFGHPVDRENGYFQRVAERQKLILSYLEQQIAAGLLARWDYPAMSLYSMLDWANFRKLLPADQLGESLQRFATGCEPQRLVAQTDPRLA